MAKLVLHKCPCLRPKIEEEVHLLDYRHCSLNDLPSEVFSFERTLEELYADSNQLKDLPRELFYCHGLRKLSVSDNEITIIPPAIASLDHLEELDISKNGIINIPENIKCCKYLRIVDASVNPFGKFPEGFAQLQNLTNLCLNDTFLDYLPGSFGRLTKLKSLDIRENHLKTLPKSFSRLRELEKLDIGKNELTDLPDVIGNLVNLLELWCDSNQISSVTNSIGCLTQLMFLDASRNSLESLPVEVEGCTCLADLYLSYNSLCRLPDTIGNLSNLTTLKVDENQLTVLPTTLGRISSLSELNVSGNHLENFPSSIGLLHNLRTLYADDNSLSYLPAEIGSCSGITVLSLRGNKLTYIPDEIGRIPRLRVLNLSDNRLSHLPFSIVKLKQLQALWLSMNQTRPLIPLQSDYEKETGRKILTCYLLPQGQKDVTDKVKGGVENTPVESDRRSKIHFDFIDDGQVEGRLVRCPTPHPMEMRDKARHLHNMSLRESTHHQMVEKSVECMQHRNSAPSLSCTASVTTPGDHSFHRHLSSSKGNSSETYCKRMPSFTYEDLYGSQYLERCRSNRCYQAGCSITPSSVSPNCCLQDDLSVRSQPVAQNVSGRVKYSRDRGYASDLETYARRGRRRREATVKRTSPSPVVQQNFDCTLSSQGSSVIELSPNRPGQNHVSHSGFSHHSTIDSSQLTVNGKFCPDISQQSKVPSTLPIATHAMGFAVTTSALPLSVLTERRGAGACCAGDVLAMSTGSLLCPTTALDHSRNASAPLSCTNALPYQFSAGTFSRSDLPSREQDSLHAHNHSLKNRVLPINTSSMMLDDCIGRELYLSDRSLHNPVNFAEGVSGGLTKSSDFVTSPDGIQHSTDSTINCLKSIRTEEKCSTRDTYCNGSIALNRMYSPPLLGHSALQAQKTYKKLPLSQQNLCEVFDRPNECNAQMRDAHPDGKSAHGVHRNYVSSCSATQYARDAGVSCRHTPSFAGGSKSLFWKCSKSGDSFCSPNLESNDTTRNSLMTCYEDIEMFKSMHEPSSQVSSISDSGYGHNIYDQVGDGSNNHSNSPSLSTPPPWPHTPVVHSDLSAHGVVSREISPGIKGGFYSVRDRKLTESTLKGFCDIFQTTIRKNPGFGFSIAGGINSRGLNPYRYGDMGIFVTKVSPNGPAAGVIEPGDKIVRVNDIDFLHIDHHRAITEMKNLSVIDLLVERIRKVNLV